MNSNAQEKRQLQALVGHRLGPYNSFNPINRVQIWQWCSAMGDMNPLYLNDEDNIVAPPAMMQMWTMRDFNDQYAPGSTGDKPYQVFDDMCELGYAGNVAVSYDITFERYLREGERPKHYTTVVNISDKKNTALGEGFFVIEQVDYTTADEAPYATALITYFQYLPDEQADAPEDSAPAESVTRVLPVACGDWQPDYRDLSSAQLSEGQALPELAIPINHRLIVGGALASQDFTPVHHSVPVAQAASMADIFMNILTTCGLCAHYLSAWGGAGSRLKKLKFNLQAPNMPGDTMVMQGGVETLDRSAAKPLVEVKFAGKNGLGMHVTGAATLELAH